MVFVSVRPRSVASDRKQPELAPDKRECIQINEKPREKAGCDVIYVGDQLISPGLGFSISCLYDLFDVSLLRKWQDGFSISKFDILFCSNIP